MVVPRLPLRFLVPPRLQAKLLLVDLDPATPQLPPQLSASPFRPVLENKVPANYSAVKLPQEEGSL